MNPTTAIQDDYDRSCQVCYGCGELNDVGLKLKSYWDGEKATAQFIPRDHQCGFPGFVYGGLIASLMDCHAMATAAGFFRDQEPDGASTPRMVTAALNVQFVKPTPLDGRCLFLSATVKSHGERKAVVAVDLSVDDTVCARGEVTAVKMPESMFV